MKKILTLCASAALLGISLPAAAVIDDWNTTSGSSGCGWSGTNCNWGNTRTYTSDNGLNVSASAWANTVGDANTNIDDAYLAVYGSNGLGAVNQDAANGTDGNEAYNDYPEHAMDNNQRFDSILFSFDQAVKLTSVDIGYRYGSEGDVSVLAYTGGAALPANLDSYFNGLSYSALISNGWTLIGNFPNLVVGSNSVVSASSVFSSYWLVGAYNPAFGSGSGLGAGNDYVKIAGLAGERQSQCNGGGGCGSSVPEPSSLMMAGLAVALAFSAVQRRASSRA